MRGGAASSLGCLTRGVNGFTCEGTDISGQYSNMCRVRASMCRIGEHAEACLVSIGRMHSHATEDLMSTPPGPTAHSPLGFRRRDH